MGLTHLDGEGAIAGDFKNYRRQHPLTADGGRRSEQGENKVDATGLGINLVRGDKTIIKSQQRAGGNLDPLQPRVIVPDPQLGRVVLQLKLRPIEVSHVLQLYVDHDQPFILKRHVLEIEASRSVGPNR